MEESSQTYLLVVVISFCSNNSSHVRLDFKKKRLMITCLPSFNVSCNTTCISLPPSSSVRVSTSTPLLFDKWVVMITELSVLLTVI